MGRAVLHVAQPTDAGVAQCVLDDAVDQQSTGWSVTVACPSEGTLAARLTAAGVGVRDWPATRNPGATVPGETRRLRRIVASVAPDVVHLHSSKAGLAGRLALRGRHPTVFQPHAWSFDAVTGPVRAASLAWERLASRWAHRVVCVSAAERAAGEAAGVRARYVVVPNGVDLSAWPAADDDERTRARTRLGLGPEPLAVCVGRLCRQKGQDVLVAAWPAVRQQVAAARLVLVGDGPDAADLARRAGAGVHLAGHRDDVADWLAAADVAVLPSRWEGLALTVLEAMARGRSVVASDVTGMAETLGPDAGALVPPDDPRALAEAVRARLADPALAAAEGVAGRGRVSAAHDLRLTTRAIRDLYAELVGP